MFMEPVIINAEGKSFGRLASKVAFYLMQKDLVSYQPNKVLPRKVKVINLAKVKFTGKKMKTKIYRWHTGYIGHLKELTLEKMWDKNPIKVFERAVKGMLPKNRLLKKRLKLLQITL